MNFDKESKSEEKKNFFFWGGGGGGGGGLGGGGGREWREGAFQTEKKSIFCAPHARYKILSS